ncbi:DENN domain-containing protein [Mycena indigotica]|uniref:DENN domain-containing protein n=1 Tax=Mycena indigotica TaxID=2126181 RepID=A0A8H6WC30_9AGAR|nr:DENN domain-containing protein [Mycena indigotica]KAF7306924.1 DENN domain-containing protein [Mycena indigotica]
MQALRSRYSSASLESRSKTRARMEAPLPERPSTDTIKGRPSLAEELDFVTIDAIPGNPPIPRDKASRILGVAHRASMEPIPASSRTSLVSTRSARPAAPAPPFNPTSPLTSLYVVSGLPKSPHTWTLADPDAVLGLSHSDSAVNRFWRPEVLGSTVSPGAGGGIKKKRRGKEETSKGAGALSKAEVGKMLSKALKLSFTREVEVIASTLQPPSTIHTFQFTLPAPNTPLAPTPSGDLLRASVLSSDNRSSAAPSYAYPYTDDPFPRPSAAYLGPPSLLGHNTPAASRSQPDSNNNTVTYHGVCLTVWSHADAERSTAIRRTLEAGRSRKESAQSAVASRLKTLRADVAGEDPSLVARRRVRRGTRGPWTDVDTDGETDAGGASESEYEVASTAGHGPGESTLFLPGDTVFWLPYALTLVSKHPVYDLMRDYLTLSWARFSKDVQSHTLQISKILAHPAPRPGDLIKLDASPQTEGEASLEVIARFPGGLDFGRGLVDINFTMWPLFKCLSIDNILTICEIALAPTGRVIFVSRHPAMLGIAVATTKYLVELRGWNGIALPAVHSRDAKIYVEDPGPWIMGLATEARYSVRPAPEVCVVDLDINYLSCPSPPAGAVSVKQQREKYRQKLLAAFDSHYHPDHSIPRRVTIEFKEAFPAGRFRPVCKIQAKRGASSAAVAEQIQPPEWWNSTRVIQAFDMVLQSKAKKPSFLKRISSFGTPKRPAELTAAEQHIQLSIRKRATAFVDARDDLETKIGRLSRRLNYLMTESELWTQKFVTFEQYAEKLSAEATQLRSKINKEQRETKRLSGIVTLTSAEKTRLQTQLKDTEAAHREAMSELDRMRETMDRMEQERVEMVAEVEAQIERALASMAVDIESDYSSSRPSSRASSLPSSRATSRSRRESETKRPLRSFGTESTLAEEYEASAPVNNKQTETIPEEEETPASPRNKRFSATEADLQQDGMIAVDENISMKSDRIAQKVLEIQQKLETALANDRRTHRKRPSAGRESEGDTSETTSSRARHGRPARSANRTVTKGRTRSSTASSTKTIHDDSQQYPRTILIKPAESEDQQSAAAADNNTLEHAPSAALNSSTLSPVPEIQPKSRGRSASRTPSQLTTDDDSDFQSAYSQSSQEDEDHQHQRTSPLPSEEFGVYPSRDRVVSTATVVGGQETTPTSAGFQRVEN